MSLSTQDENGRFRKIYVKKLKILLNVYSKIVVKVIFKY